jgi:hypothetical protein
MGRRLAMTDVTDRGRADVDAWEPRAGGRLPALMKAGAASGKAQMRACTFAEKQWF